MPGEEDTKQHKNSSRVGSSAQFNSNTTTTVPPANVGPSSLKTSKDPDPPQERRNSWNQKNQLESQSQSSLNNKSGLGHASRSSLPKQEHQKVPPPPPPHPTSILSPLHHAEIDEDVDDEDDLVHDGGNFTNSSNGSKLDLELQFAGVDNETVELDEEISNYPGFQSSPGTRDGKGKVPNGDDLSEKDGQDPDPNPTTEPILPIPPTLREKIIFYTTAFFILLAIFSLFLFLFLVPFVIDPAFTTIFNDFDPEPALCETFDIVSLGGKNCTDSWTSCREGCTKDVFNCTQIWVRYRVNSKKQGTTEAPTSSSSQGSHWSNKPHKQPQTHNNNNYYASYQVSRKEFRDNSHKKSKHKGNRKPETERDNLITSRREPLPGGWEDVRGQLYPNVKGCGYPPSVNCTIFLKKYAHVGHNFSCYYSKVKPWLVVTTFNMNQVVLELALSMAIPIPCFIISVIYLVFAYFKIYGGSNGTQELAIPAPPPVDSSTANNIITNNNICTSPSHRLPPGSELNDDEPEHETSLVSTVDEKARTVLIRSTSKGLNSLLPNSGKAHVLIRQDSSGIIELNDLSVARNPTNSEGDLPPPLLSSKHNTRAPERNGPTNPAAKNTKGT